MNNKDERLVLNLGCGETRIPGSKGVDCVALDGWVDVVHDLNQTPYPFDASSVDQIHMYHVLEHLDAPVQKLEELHRILKPGGVLHLRVPHFSSMGAFSDITHRRPFGYGSFNCLEAGDTHQYYCNVRYRILNREIKYFGQYPNSGFYAEHIHPNRCPVWVRPWVRLINFLAKLSPTFFERVWCYWVGGACEIVVDLEAVK